MRNWGSGKVPTTWEPASGKSGYATGALGNYGLKDLIGRFSNCFRGFENQASGTRSQQDGELGVGNAGVWCLVRVGGRGQVNHRAKKDSFAYSPTYKSKRRCFSTAHVPTCRTLVSIVLKRWRRINQSHWKGEESIWLMIVSKQRQASPNKKVERVFFGLHSELVGFLPWSAVCASIFFQKAKDKTCTKNQKLIAWLRHRAGGCVKRRVCTYIWAHVRALAWNSIPTCEALHLYIQCSMCGDLRAYSVTIHETSKKAMRGYSFGMKIHTNWSTVCMIIYGARDEITSGVDAFTKKLTWKWKQGTVCMNIGGVTLAVGPRAWKFKCT